MGIALISFDGDIDEDITQQAEEEKAEHTVTQLCLAERQGFLMECRGIPCQGGKQRRQSGSRQISQPDQRESEGIASVILKNITDLPREQVKAIMPKVI